VKPDWRLELLAGKRMAKGGKTTEDPNESQLKFVEQLWPKRANANRTYL
jgi:hypothetical protein